MIQYNVEQKPRAQSLFAMSKTSSVSFVCLLDTSSTDTLVFLIIALVFVHLTEGIMALIPAAEAKQHGDHLLGKLRRFSADHVKISARDQEWARGLVDDILKGKVFKLCQERSRLPISHFEYTGSVYERLKTEAADEVDVMVVLKTNRREVVAETAVPGEDKQGTFATFGM